MSKVKVNPFAVGFLIALFGKSNLEMMELIEKDKTKLAEIKEALKKINEEGIVC